jgi:activator of HSP90 ATPase
MASRDKTIVQTVVLPATPAQVYAAFTNARIHAAFTGAPATGRARVVGAFTAWDGYIFGVHRELTKDQHIVQDWQTTEWPDGAAPSRLELSFTAVAGGTEVRMVHSNVPADQADGYRQGWIDYYWNPLKAYFNEGRTAGRN